MLLHSFLHTCSISLNEMYVCSNMLLPPSTNKCTYTSCLKSNVLKLDQLYRKKWQHLWHQFSITRIILEIHAEYVIYVATFLNKVGQSFKTWLRTRIRSILIWGQREYVTRVILLSKRTRIILKQFKWCKVIFQYATF
jgi:hypothetical protein